MAEFNINEGVRALDAINRGYMAAHVPGLADLFSDTGVVASANKVGEHGQLHRFGDCRKLADDWAEHDRLSDAYMKMYERCVAESGDSLDPWCATLLMYATEQGMRADDAEAVWEERCQFGNQNIGDEGS